MKTHLEPQMNADERRWIWAGFAISYLPEAVRKYAGNTSAQVHLRSSAFICGSIAFAFSYKE
jgi:hypothetical protein